MRKAERLLNLIALLLETRRPLSVDHIRDAIPGYQEQSETAFRRMFERDKEELRDLGMPVELRPTDAWGDEGYIIPKREAFLLDPGLTPDEQAALSLSAQAWGGSIAGGNPAMALLKLSLAAGIDDAGGAPWLLPRAEPAEPRLDLLLEAILRRKHVTFVYRTGGAATERTVEPWRLLHRGAWYLTGQDRARRGIRHFKLSRVEGALRLSPGLAPDFDPPDASALEPLRAPWEAEAALEARVAFSPELAWWAERRTGARRAGDRPDGWVEIVFSVAETISFLDWILGFGDDAVVLAPDALRSNAVRRLEAVAGRPAAGRSGASP